jgi:hypothetical protein
VLFVLLASLLVVAVAAVLAAWMKLGADMPGRTGPNPLRALGVAATTTTGPDDLFGTTTSTTPADATARRPAGTTATTGPATSATAPAATGSSLLPPSGPSPRPGGNSAGGGGAVGSARPFVASSAAPAPAPSSASGPGAGSGNPTTATEVAANPTPATRVTEPPPPVEPRPTTPPAPVSPFLGVAVGEVDSVPGQRTAVVRWAISGTAGSLGGFEVSWNDGHRVLTQRVGPDARQSQVDGLQPSTPYSVQILPIATDGRPDRGAAVSTSVTTLPAALAAPRPPGNLRVVSGPGSLTVSWTADPSDLATAQFFVSWGCCGGYLNGVPIDRDARSYTISGLAPGVDHVVEIQVIGANLEGVPATKRTTHGVPD